MIKKKVSECAVEYILTRDLDDLKELTVEKIAKNIGINKLYLSLMFIIDQRITIPGFIVREKLHEAYFILEGCKKKKVVELSKELGFQDTEEFNMEFEKYFAIKPEEFKDIKSKISYKLPGKKDPKK